MKDHAWKGNAKFSWLSYLDKLKITLSKLPTKLQILNFADQSSKPKLKNWL